MPRPSDVSVIVPVYQPPATFWQALQSVLSQAPGEIVLVDDHSPTPLPPLPSSETPTRVIRHEFNKGPGAARNTGALASQKKWVSFIDADDLWEPGRLELQTRMASEKTCDVVLGKTGYIGPDGAPDPRGREPRFLPNMGSMLVKRDVFLELLQDESSYFGEDLDFYLQLKEKGLCVERHPELVLWYRQTVGGLTDKRSSENKKKDLIRVLRRSLQRRRATSLEQSK
jgi:glycosyltransferase involved in cell wall biosynthesis